MSPTRLIGWVDPGPLPSSMKILRIIARLNVGGPARHVVWLTDALNDGEFETRLIAGTVPPGEEDMAWFAEANGVEPVYIKEMSRELSPKDLFSIWKVFREIHRFRPDIVHTHTAKAGTVGRLAAFAYKWLTPSTLLFRPRMVKVVHTFHGHVFHSYYSKAKTSVFLFIEKLLARFATDRIVTITDQQLKEINKDFGVGNEKKFAVIPLGIDLSALGPGQDTRSTIRAEFGIKDNEFLIGFVGRLTEIKNISMFSQAAKSCLDHAEADERFRFVIVGDGHLREALEKETQDLGIAESVIFAGNRTDIPAVYSALDLVALTSLNEGTPLSLIEAMAAGKPVISTAVGGVVDLLGTVEERSNGLAICQRGISVASNDAEALALGIREFARNEERRSGVSAAGHDFVSKKYSKERLVNDIKELYRQLYAGTKQN